MTGGFFSPALRWLLGRLGAPVTVVPPGVPVCLTGTDTSLTALSGTDTSLTALSGTDTSLTTFTVVLDC